MNKHCDIYIGILLENMKEWPSNKHDSKGWISKIACWVKEATVILRFYVYKVLEQMKLIYSEKAEQCLYNPEEWNMRDEDNWGKKALWEYRNAL